jgi:arabinogalactan endo-1,4-beta-galactosidase
MATGGLSVTGGTSSSSGSQNISGGVTTGGTRASGGAFTTGGSTLTGGSSALGGASGRDSSIPTGGVSTPGGASAAGGASAGRGSSTGGSQPSGGASNTGGTRPTGGTSSVGGTRPAGGASGTGGTTGNCPAMNPNLFAIGADVSQVPQDENGGRTRYVDTDGGQKDILAILKDHGFNYMRLRTFVDPKASDGYSSSGYCDLDHTIAMAKRVKQACMGLLVDFHYSDNWADPGKQCIPVAWQSMNLAQMTQQVHDYTYDSVKALVNAGVRPDMVQVGNEITPGMLVHLCDSTGTPTSTNSVNGSVSNWANLAGFLNAGIKAVHEVDPTIKIMLHIERGGSATDSANWLNNALSRNVVFDVFGESTYVAYQGQPAVWQSTFDTLVGTSAFSALQFASAEYNNESVTSPAGTTSMRDINDTIFKIANNRGFGTFFWEPTRSGAWGAGLFTWSGTSCTAISSAFAVYDGMKTAYTSRL